MATRRAVDGDVVLRDVVADDLPAFFEHQNDPRACELGAFTPRSAAAFHAHWEGILRDRTVTRRTVVFRGEVAGYLVAFESRGRTCVGYWLGARFWGQGVASLALRAFLDRVAARPLHAHVATRNAPSIRVLEKCGFEIDRAAAISRGDDGVDELLMVLPGVPAKSR